MGGLINAEYELFRASWLSRFELPDAWYAEHTKGRPRFYALFWAPRLDVDPEQNNQCKKNAEDFKSLAQSLSDHNLKGYELFSPEPIKATLTRHDAMKQLDELSNLQKGDCCVIFYSGIGLDDLSQQKHSLDYFPEPGFYGDNLAGFDTKQNSELRMHAEGMLRNNLLALSNQKGVHVFVVLDYKYLVNTNLPYSSSIQVANNSLVILTSPALALNNGYVDTAGRDNFFFEELVDTITDMGAKIRYANLLSRLQLRYYQAGLDKKPTLQAFPIQASNTYLFSGIPSGKSLCRVYYSEVNMRWELNSGALHGIRPSLGFMHTQFMLDDGRTVSIADTYESFSTLLNFEEANTGNTFDATLTQNALPKMRVAFHKELTAEMRSRFEDVVQYFKIYFIDLLDDEEQASFLIRNREQEFYLVRNRVGHDEKPIFFYQSDTHEFIKQMEYIAQWQALLELENSNTSLESKDFGVTFEVIEGGKGRWDAPPTAIYENPENLVLHYKDYRGPSFRCGVKYVSNNVDKKYHVNFLYLGTCFGIVKIDSLNSDLIQHGEMLWAGYNDSKNIPVFLDNIYLENEIFEIQEYILVLFSTESVDVTPLIQSDLDLNHRQVSRSGFDIEDEKPSFVLPEGDWYVRKVPIRIVHDGNFEQNTR